MTAGCQARPAGAPTVRRSAWQAGLHVPVSGSGWPSTRAPGGPFYFAWGCFRNFVSGPRGTAEEALHRVWDTDKRYFRTQITRTTDALASGDPSAPLTPLALRKSRTVSEVTSTAWAAPFAGPATTTGFSSAIPANLPSPSSAAAPEKPSAGGGDSATSLPPPSWATEALMLLTAPPPPWFCGSAMPVRSSAVFEAGFARLSGLKPRAP